MPSNADARLGNLGVAKKSRPMVSVCMASYNGERFIQEQIQSILPQLAEHDEVIVVDDASTDRTIELVMGFYDCRIKLIEHVKNQGVVATFEDAVRNATGEILFLSDGDDIWAADKLTKVLRAFAQDPCAQVVATGLQLIDGEGKILDSQKYLRNRPFSAALLPNLVRNRFQGSTMAFRSSLLHAILPFPRGRAFLHDAWIGNCNILFGGHTIYLDEPLLYYRRHQNNFSKRLSLLTQISARTQLIFALTLRWLRTVRTRRS